MSSITRVHMDLTGQRFGHLVVLKENGKINSSSKRKPSYAWFCRCDCGKEVVVRGDSLRSSHATSCGCIRKHIDLTGQRFGKLVVIRENGKTVSTAKKASSWLWLCKCDCGKETNVRGDQLRSGHTSSCGCFQKENLERIAKNNIKDPHHVAAHLQYLRYKQTSRYRNMVFTLTEDDVFNIVFRPCAYCGAPPSKQQLDSNDRFIALVNGIDRIHNEKGYDPDNIAPCCWTCNKAKGTATYNEFMDWTKRLIIFQLNKGTI